MDVLPVNAALGAAAKVSYVARGLIDAGFGTTRPVAVSMRPGRPRPGDFVLCEVTAIGQHKVLGQRDGVRNTLFPGDRIVVAYGGRYAPDQFEAEVPGDLGPCHLAAAGGIAAHVVSKHAKMAPPTALEPLGLLVDEAGDVLNLRSLARPAIAFPTTRPTVLAVVGSSMNAGKTTAVASLVRGLALAGHRVGAAKITGTGAPGDPTLMAAAGAAHVLDFTDLGHPSTYQLASWEVVSLLEQAIAQLAAERVDVAVLEIADGILQQETAALLETPRFHACVDRVLFAAADAMSAVAGARTLKQLGLPIVALTGLVTAAPLAMGEAARASDVPVVPSHDLALPQVATRILGAPTPVDPARTPTELAALAGAAEAAA